ncbi:DUF2306 domain-containing protein [Falsiroseomonas sp. HW251]|uniref:DUF2306 domain-containing protein n=1 Tax=Falsiroseomonas sp. HW251 TaxID=3390998 RepID=UPI003D31A12D
MNLAPLTAAPVLVQLHVAAALGALLVGILQFAGRKGRTPHRVLGWAWVGLMLAVALSALGITGKDGRYSWIHLIVPFVLVLVPLAVLMARRHRVGRHRNLMLGLYLGALVLTGLFTLMPGRIMHDVLLGG